MDICIRSRDKSEASSGHTFKNRAIAGTRVWNRYVEARSLTFPGTYGVECNEGDQSIRDKMFPSVQDMSI